MEELEMNVMAERLGLDPADLSSSEQEQLNLRITAADSDPATELEMLIEDELGGFVSCKFCHSRVAVRSAHLHQSNWVGICCWDERLRASE